MRERTFRKPTVREVLEMEGAECPHRINNKFISHLIATGVLVPVGDSYEQAVRVVEELEEGRFALFGNYFRVSRAESDYGIKSLDDLVKIDSQSTLKKVSGMLDVPRGLTKRFAEQHGLLPHKLIGVSMGEAQIEKPPTGFYWVGTNKQVRATTWMKAVAGAEMEVMKQQGDFYGKVIDKTPYGRNLRVQVSSRTEEGKIYEFTLFRLPMHKKGDIEMFSNWMNIAHNSSDPDTSYRGGEHERRVNPVCLWSAPTIFSFYEAMSFVEEHPDWRQFRINPFPIPRDKKMMDFIDKLRLRSLLLDNSEEKLRLYVLTKRTMDGVIGAKTILRRYDNCWRHWGKKDNSYLYQPQ